MCLCVCVPICDRFESVGGVEQRKRLKVGYMTHSELPAEEVRVRSTSGQAAEGRTLDAERETFISLGSDDGGGEGQEQNPTLFALIDYLPSATRDARVRWSRPRVCLFSVPFLHSLCCQPSSAPSPHSTFNPIQCTAHPMRKPTIPAFFPVSLPLRKPCADRPSATVIAPRSPLSPTSRNFLGTQLQRFLPRPRPRRRAGDVAGS